MNVRCPRCSTGYRLPEHLMGARGARVRCPRCGASFEVLRESAEESEVDDRGEHAVAALAPHTVAPRDPALAPEALAASLLARLEERLGARLETARREHRVLSEFGPDLLGAWEEFRAQDREGGSPEVFRRLLRERWSVDLAPRGRS
jgi:predicted Zn finger-like uncharacterized protein